MPVFVRQLVSAYGSFLFFRSPWANLLLVAATLVVPQVGLCGLAAGAATLAGRRLCGLPDNTGGIDVVNGVLAGLLIGATFAFEPRVLAMAGVAGLAAAPVGRLAHDRLVLRAGLPMLSAPLMLIAPLALAFGRALALPWAPWPAGNALDLALAGWLPALARGYLHALGGIYFSGSLSGGLLVLAAVLLASRGLAVLSLLAWAGVAAVLSLFGLPPASPALIPAGGAGILAAIMCGGVFSRPGARALCVGLAAAVAAGLLALALANAFWYFAVPPLSLPFLAVTWMVMSAMGRGRGGAWAGYWLAAPQVPERSHEARRLAEARGFGQGSVALRAPFLGAWEVYQGFDGRHTHQGPWRHALDFHRLVEGRAHGGDGSSLADYHCYGATICAPAAGRVVHCRDDLPDNPPGRVERAHPWGNYVLIGVDEGVYVLLAHLQQGSLGVAAGQAVALGQKLGRCGNSGRSPQPHLHLHVQSEPELGAPTRPFHLAFVRLDGELGARLAFDAVPRATERVAVPRPDRALEAALHRDPGGRSGYLVARGGGEPVSWCAEVRLDLLGQAWIEAGTGAAIASTATDCAVALHDRRGPSDPVLNAFALAAGLTPLTQERAVWRDAPPLKLVPAPGWVRAVNWLLPGAAAVETRYRLDWLAEELCWRQYGEHAVLVLGRPVWACRSWALFAEGEGVRAFALEARGRECLRAVLASRGLTPDLGIPGWDRPTRLVA